MKFRKPFFYALLASCAVSAVFLGAPAPAFAQSGGAIGRSAPLPKAEPKHKAAPAHTHKISAEQKKHDDISDIINAAPPQSGRIMETAPKLPAAAPAIPAPAPKPAAAAHRQTEHSAPKPIRGAEPRTLEEQVAPAAPLPASLPKPAPKPQRSGGAQSQNSIGQDDKQTPPMPDLTAPVPIPMPAPAPSQLFTAPPEPRVNDTLEPQAAPYEAAPNAPLTYPQSSPGFWQSRNYPRFGDRKPHIWTSRRKPWHYAIHGTDVSWHNSSIDWTQMARSGISFVFIKATEGGDHQDPAFKANWQAAGQVGLMRGAYHFYYFCRTPKEQLRWYIQNVPRGSNTLPPALDMEWNHTSATCRRHPSPDEVRKDMKIFLEGAERYYHKKPIIYTTVDFFRDNGLDSFRGYPFWLRSVAAHPDDRYNRQPWMFWQYTGTGRVPGISGDADISVFVGSPKQWQSYLRTIGR